MIPLETIYTNSETFSFETKIQKYGIILVIIAGRMLRPLAVLSVLSLIDGQLVFDLH